jgi:hypothetical protein
VNNSSSHHERPRLPSRRQRTLARRFHRGLGSCRDPGPIASGRRRLRAARSEAPHADRLLRERRARTRLEIERATRGFTTQAYRTNFGDPTTFTIEAARDYGAYLIKVLIPLLIILVLAYLVFFVPARELEVAVGLTVTSVLACIAFQLTVAGDLPHIGYVVTSDRIFHLCYS